MGPNWYWVIMGLLWASFALYSLYVLVLSELLPFMVYLSVSLVSTVTQLVRSNICAFQ